MNTKKWNLNGSTMSSGFWGEKPKKKLLNKFFPNRIDENDETKDSYPCKNNNTISSSKSDENVYSMNKLKRKAPIGSSKSDENDHSYLIKEKELQEKRKRRVPLFQNEFPVNFLAEPIKLQPSVVDLQLISKPPLDLNAIKKSIIYNNNKADPVLLNPSNLTYRVEPTTSNQALKMLNNIENEIIPKNDGFLKNNLNKHFKKADDESPDLVHRIKSEENKKNQQMGDTPKIKLFETGNNKTNQKSKPATIQDTNQADVRESEILSLNILPQNETSEKLKIKPKTGRKDDNSTSLPIENLSKTPKKDENSPNEIPQNTFKVSKPKTAHKQEENTISQQKNEHTTQNPSRVLKPKTAHRQDESYTFPKSNEQTQNPTKTSKPKTAHRQDDNQKINESSQIKTPKPKPEHKQDDNSTLSKSNEEIQNQSKTSKPKTAHKPEDINVTQKTNDPSKNPNKTPKPKTARRPEDNQKANDPNASKPPKTDHKPQILYINGKPIINYQNSKPTTTDEREENTTPILKNSNQKNKPSSNDNDSQPTQSAEMVQKIKMSPNVREIKKNQDPVSHDSPIAKSSGKEKPIRETKTAKKSNEEARKSIPSKTENKKVVKKIAPGQHEQLQEQILSNQEKDPSDKSKLFLANNIQQQILDQEKLKTSTPTPVLIQVSPIDQNQEITQSTTIDIHENDKIDDQLIKEDPNSHFKIYSPNENDESTVKYDKLNNEKELSKLSLNAHIVIQTELSTSALIQQQRQLTPIRKEKKESSHYFRNFINTLKHKTDEIIEKRNKRTIEERKKSHIKLMNICSILLCILCPLTGLLSIYYSRKSKKYFEMKDIENTKKTLNRSEWMLISTVFIGTIIFIGILASLAFSLNWFSF